MVRRFKSYLLRHCGYNSIGRVPVFQTGSCEFDSRYPLQKQIGCFSYKKENSVLIYHQGPSVADCKRRVCRTMGWHPPFWIFVKIPQELPCGLQARQNYSCNHHAPLSLTGRAYDCSVEIRVQIPRDAPYYGKRLVTETPHGTSPYL